MNKFLLILMVASGFLFTSCLDDNETSDPIEQLEEEQAQIDEYIAENGLQAQIDDMYDLRYVIEEQGTGATPHDTTLVTVSYTGRLLSNGTVFDESDSAVFNLGRLLPGWRILLPKIQEGGKMTMFIPSYYGYGNQDLNNIPANSTLIFDVELKSVDTRLELEQRLFANYIEEEGLDADTASSGLMYVIVEEGTGNYPAPESRVNVDYEGRVLGRNEPFDAGTGVQFNLGSLIKGWSLLLPEVKEGGTIIMFIPSQYGYGSNPVGDLIPANSPLIFEVTLNSIVED